MLSEKNIKSIRIRLSRWQIVYSIISFIFLFSANILSQVSHTVNFSNEKLNLSEVTGGDKANYTKVEFNDFQNTSEVGNPALPVKFVHLIIPSNQTAQSIKINSLHKNSINISYDIYPS